MISTITHFIPYLVVGFQIFLVFALITLLTRKSFGKEMVHWAGKHAVVLGFLVSLMAITGSLFYSEIVGYTPCVLCWWQRIFLYPQIILFIIALRKRDRGVFKYSVALASFAGVFALYHSYVYAGGKSLLPCTALGGACSKVYVYAFKGLVTIPSMSLTIVIAFILLYIANKLHENRHA